MSKRKVPPQVVGGKFVVLMKPDEHGSGRYRDVSESLALLKHLRRMKERKAKQLESSQVEDIPEQGAELV